MTQQAFNINSILNSLTQFDSAVESSAVKMKNNFDVELESLSTSFTETATIATTVFSDASGIIAER